MPHSKELILFNWWQRSFSVSSVSGVTPSFWLITLAWYEMQHKWSWVYSDRHICFKKRDLNKHPSFNLEEPGKKNKLRPKLAKEKIKQGLPGGSLVRNPLANAGDEDSTPGSGRSHVTEQLSLYATTAEPGLWSPGAATMEPMCHNCWSWNALELMLCNKRKPRQEKPSHHN